MNSNKNETNADLDNVRRESDIFVCFRFIDGLKFLDRNIKSFYLKFEFKEGKVLFIEGKVQIQKGLDGIIQPSIANEMSHHPVEEIFYDSFITSPLEVSKVATSNVLNLTECSVLSNESLKWCMLSISDLMVMQKQSDGWYPYFMKKFSNILHRFAPNSSASSNSMSITPTAASGISHYLTLSPQNLRKLEEFYTLILEKGPTALLHIINFLSMNSELIPSGKAAIICLSLTLIKEILRRLKEVRNEKSSTMQHDSIVIPISTSRSSVLLNSEINMPSASKSYSNFLSDFSATFLKVLSDVMILNQIALLIEEIGIISTATASPIHYGLSIVNNILRMYQQMD